MENHKEKMLKLQIELLAVERDRINGNQEYSINEVVQMMNNVVNERNDANKQYQFQMA